MLMILVTPVTARSGVHSGRLFFSDIRKTRYSEIYVITVVSDIVMVIKVNKDIDIYMYIHMHINFLNN